MQELRKSWEFLVLLIVASVLVTTVLTRVWPMRLDAERAHVAAVTGNLRAALGMRITALVLSGEIAALEQVEGSNPFSWYESPPANYRGEVEADGAIPAGEGIWYFDQSGRCVVYRPRFPEAFAGARRLRFKVHPIPRTRPGTQGALGNFELGALK